MERLIGTIQTFQNTTCTEHEYFENKIKNINHGTSC